MKVSVATNNIACQPLKFGAVQNSPTPPAENKPVETPKTVSKAEYDKLNAKYQLACRLAVAQADQYNKYVASCKK